jgi:Holliday junction resolvase-like predicted endonuclease
MQKPFDQGLYDAHDARGREAVKAWLKQRGCRVEDFFQYDVDLIVQKGTRWICFVEVEVRGWNVCGYDTIHIALRKKKLLDNEMPTYMFVVGNSLKTAYFCNAKKILSCPVVEVKNRFVSEGEMFFDVPVKMFKQINL